MYFLEKIHWAPSEILEVKRPFSRSRRPNFGFHLFLMGFHLEFLLFLVSRLFDLSDLGDLRRGSGNFFKITFLKSVRSNEKDEVCHSFVVEIFTKSLHRGGVIVLYELFNRVQTENRFQSDVLFCKGFLCHPWPSFCCCIELCSA